MNAPETPQPTAMADVQGSADTRRIAINKVGIKAIRHPVKVLDKSGGVQHTIAMFNMYVGLPHNFKGTHMSRFVEILNTNEREISVENFEPMLRAMVERLRAKDTYIYLRTTLLVGHPGETDESFQRLYDFVEEGEIDHLGVFPEPLVIHASDGAEQAVPERHATGGQGGTQRGGARAVHTCDDQEGLITGNAHCMASIEWRRNSITPRLACARRL